MTAGFRFSFPVTVTPLASEDEYGDETPGTPYTVDGCVIYPRSSGEQHDFRDTITVGLVLLAPVGSDIRARYTVTLPVHPHVPVYYQQTQWRVEGEPGSWSSPYTGWQPGVEIALERVTG